MAYQKAFQAILEQDLEKSLLRKIILEISTSVMPNCSNPLFLSDFLTVNCLSNSFLVVLLVQGGQTNSSLLA
jgi:hypothetical protein